MSKKPIVISVFGSSQVSAGMPAYEEGVLAGALLAREGLTVCTGGYGGVMEAVSRGAKEAGGRVLGVTSRTFSHRTPNPWLDEEIGTDTLIERVRTLVETGDGYLTLQGGIGTLTELSMVWSLLQTRSLPPRPFVLLQDPWQGLLEFGRARLILRPQDLDCLQMAADPASAVQLLVRSLRGSGA
jgi:uncharacterized protein (TIGR00725 family)